MMKLRHAATCVLLAVLATFAHAARPVCTMVADAATGQVVLHEGHCDERVTPASTFKLALAVMGFDHGFLKDPHAPVEHIKTGDPDWGGKAWHQPIDPTLWLQYSVVWYSQQITRTLGPRRFSAYVARFGYGNQDVTGNRGKDDGLTNAWLSSSLKISPLGQLQFLRRVVRRTLPVSPLAYEKTAAITRVVGDFDGWEVHGKTGSGAPRDHRGVLDDRIGYGWFVGWAETDGRRLVFARLEESRRKTPGSFGALVRENFLKGLPALAARLPK